MPKRDFLQISDLSAAEAAQLFELASAMKSGQYRDQPLLGKALAMIFAKSSTRTRVSFEVGARSLGGHAIFLSSQDMQLGRGETISDTALVLSRYVDGIMIRTFAHSDVEELAHHASIPVVNGLTDLLHPCQVLSDVFTAVEALGGLEGRVFAWIGDGNNMANSWLNAAAMFGFELRLACPEGYEPDHEIFNQAKQRTRVSIFEDPLTRTSCSLPRTTRSFSTAYRLTVVKRWLELSSTGLSHACSIRRGTDCTCRWRCLPR
ncbi:MAG: hypothetical protein P8X82_10100 [Gemmatimonadales bacterium]